MGAVRLVERFNGALSSCRVDEDAGVIHGAVLCGFTSANGRDYPRHVLEAATPKYAGAKIHVNHSRDGRTIQDWVGVIEDPVPGPTAGPAGGWRCSSPTRSSRSFWRLRGATRTSSG